MLNLSVLSQWKYMNRILLNLTVFNNPTSRKPIVLLQDSYKLFLLLLQCQRSSMARQNMNGIFHRIKTCTWQRRYQNFEAIAFRKRLNGIPLCLLLLDFESFKRKSDEMQKRESFGTIKAFQIIRDLKLNNRFIRLSQFGTMLNTVLLLPCSLAYYLAD